MTKEVLWLVLVGGMILWRIAFWLLDKRKGRSK